MVRTVVLWVASVALALMFLLAGSMKFLSPEAPQMFSQLGYPDGFFILIGALEIAGGVLLLVPRTAFFAALGLAVIMVGAVYTMIGPAHNTVGAVVPAAFLIALVLIALARRPRAAVPAWGNSQRSTE